MSFCESGSGSVDPAGMTHCDAVTARVKLSASNKKPNRKRDERQGASVEGERLLDGPDTTRRESGARARVNVAHSLQTAQLTDPGRVRDHNEDCIESRPEIGLYVLADGMGGYNAGEVASGMATSLIADGLQETWVPREMEHLGRDQAKAESERLIREQIARANN